MSAKMFMWIALGVQAIDVIATFPMMMMNTAMDLLSMATVILAFIVMVRSK